MVDATGAAALHEDQKSGHINGLDSKQEEALKQIWKRFLEATKDARKAAAEELDASADSDPSKPSARPKPTRAQTNEQAGRDKGQQSAEDQARDLKELLSQHGPQGFHKAFWQFCMAEQPDSLMLRFLRARNWDVDQAFKMLASTIKWRIETDIAGIIAKGEDGLAKQEGIKKNLGMAKAYFHGTDKQNRPVIYARAKHHKAADQTNEEMLQYIVYQMETSRTLLPLEGGVETTSVVFDLSGLGMGNVDWDTATMVIKIFQSYYPETLGHAVVWNAPTLFSGMWKIIKPMLDPVVKEKIAFASSGKEMEEFIDPKHLEKDFGGTSTWRYRFKEPVEGENDQMKDEEAKKARMADMQKVISEFSEATEKWVDGDSGAGKERSEKLRKHLEIRRLDLDPYIRGTTVFKRDGTVVGDGMVKWRYDHGRTEEFGISADDYAQELGITEPPTRPKNKDEDDLVLSSDEDTVSDTTDSESDILDDPHHRHHNSVAVGFAKFGDTVANKFSKIGPGLSLHEKKRQKREKKHAEHEASRAKKLEKKRARIEAEHRHQEELEEANRKAEEDGAIENSYQAWLGQIAWAPVGLATSAVGAATSAVSAATGAAQGDDAAGTSTAQSNTNGGTPPAAVDHIDKEKAKDEMAIENGAKAGPERAEQAAAPERKPVKPVKPKGQPAGGIADYLPAVLVLALALLGAYYGGSYLRGSSSSKAASAPSTSLAHSPAATASTTAIAARSNVKVNAAATATVTVTTTQYVTITNTPAASPSSEPAARPAAAARPAGSQQKGRVEIHEPESPKDGNAPVEVVGQAAAAAAGAAAMKVAEAKGEPVHGRGQQHILA